MREPRIARAIAVAALALAVVVPPAADASVVTSYGQMRMDDWIKVKTFQVTAEAVHIEDGEPVGVLSAPSQQNSTRVTGNAEVCVMADSYVEKDRERTHIRERACPKSLNGFRYNLETHEASIVGTVKTQLWTQEWEVIGGRWVIVKDKTVARSAKINLRWRWTENPLMHFATCGSNTAFASGIAGVATVNGSIKFNGAGITAKPSNRAGFLFVGTCARPI